MNISYSDPTLPQFFQIHDERPRFFKLSDHLPIPEDAFTPALYRQYINQDLSKILANDTMETVDLTIHQTRVLFYISRLYLEEPTEKNRLIAILNEGFQEKEAAIDTRISIGIALVACFFLSLMFSQMLLALPIAIPIAIGLAVSTALVTLSIDSYQNYQSGCQKIQAAQTQINAPENVLIVEEAISPYNTPNF